MSDVTLNPVRRGSSWGVIVTVTVNDEVPDDFNTGPVGNNKGTRIFYKIGDLAQKVRTAPFTETGDVPAEGKVFLTFTPSECAALKLLDDKCSGYVYYINSDSTQAKGIEVTVPTQKLGLDLTGI